MVTTSESPPVGLATGTVTLVHLVPLKCSNTGAALWPCKPGLVCTKPAAQMSDGDDPEIEVMPRLPSVLGMGSLVFFHVLPLKCSASPLSLTDHRFVAEKARTGPSANFAGRVMFDHEVPLKWKATDSSGSDVPVSMMPFPTAVMLSADVPVMKFTLTWPLPKVAIPAGSPCPVQLVPFQCSKGSPV